MSDDRIAKQYDPKGTPMFPGWEEPKPDQRKKFNRRNKRTAGLKTRSVPCKCPNCGHLFERML